MYNNFYFLRKLTAELEPILVESALVECFSQSKDELVLRFLTKKNTEFIIKANLGSEFCCLSFPETFARARKNSVDLFTKFFGGRVTHIRQFNNERSFSIHFHDNNSLLFKMHGNRANIVAFEGSKPTGLFRNHLKADLEINPDTLDKSIDFDIETFRTHIDNPEKYYVTLGSLSWLWLKERNWDQLTLENKWNLFLSLLKLVSGEKYFICQLEGKYILTLFELGTVIQKFNSPIQAINEFCRLYLKSNSAIHERDSLLKQLNTEIKHARNYIAKNKIKLDQLTHDDHYQKWANLIMANMHKIREGVEFVELDDLYNPPNSIQVPLSATLSPQDNAERYYRKGRNQKVEIQKLDESIQAKAKVMADLLQVKSTLENSEDPNILKEITKSIRKEIKPREETVQLPYHEFVYMNFRIWVGRNAENNDKLTLKFAHKEDLWLHVKDVPGSHVVVKYQAGKTFPREVIQRAAELAAFNSKRKTDSLCPVIYTSKKYVRKRKGDPPGAVVVEREKVIMVEPKK